MNLFFQIQSFQLVIFYMDNQECLANLDYVLLCFFVTSSKLIIFCLFFYIAIFHLFFHLPELFHLHISYVSIKLIDYPLGKITSQGCPEHVPKKHLMDVPICSSVQRQRTSSTDVLGTLKYDVMRTSQCNVLRMPLYCPTCNTMRRPLPTS